MFSFKERRLDLHEQAIYDVSDFDCGNIESLNSYITGDAFQDNLNRNVRAFLIIEQKSDKIIGYYTLRSSSIKSEGEYYPVIEIARLAIHKDYQKQGLGTAIILGLIGQKVYKISELIGIKGILVFADSDAIDFYRKRVGFVELTKNSIEVIEDNYRDDCTALILKTDDDFQLKSDIIYNTLIEDGLFIDE